jgi:hypothetical protein
MQKYHALLDGAAVADRLGAQRWLIAKPLPCFLKLRLLSGQVMSQLFLGTGFDGVLAW